MRTEGLSILAALAIHAGVFLVARAMPPLADLVARDRRPIDTIDIVELPPSQPVVAKIEETAPEAPRPPEAEAPRPEARPIARGETPPTTGPRAPSNVEPPPENTPPTPSPKPTTQWDELPPEQRGGVLGANGVPGVGGPAWAIPGVVEGPARAPAAPTVAPAPRPVDKDIAGKVLRTELAAKDKEIGLDLPLAGTMASAARAVVASSELPAGTKGSIQCTVSPSGRVSNCRLLASNNASGAWDGVVRAAASVAGAALPAQYASGAVVTIDLSVANTPPAGGKGGLSGAGASFDISNIGAHATRQVRVSHRVVAAR